MQNNLHVSAIEPENDSGEMIFLPTWRLAAADGEPWFD